MAMKEDSEMFKIFRILDKYKEYPEILTRAERKRLKELGIVRDENAD